jgi:hypothetical protein
MANELNEPNMSVTAPIAPVVAPVFQGMKERKLDMVRDTWDINRSMQWYNKSISEMYSSVFTTASALMELAEKDKQNKIRQAIELREMEIKYRGTLNEPFEETEKDTDAQIPEGGAVSERPTGEVEPTGLVRLPAGSSFKGRTWVTQEQYDEWRREEERKQAIRRRRAYMTVWNLTGFGGGSDE